jgi:drug/metabolite transporter (DMT)-like permease
VYKKLGFIFISISIFSFSISNCLWSYPLKRHLFLQAIILRSFLSALLLGSLIGINAFTGVSQTAFESIEASNDLSLISVAKAVAVSAFSYFGLFFYVKSLRHEKVSIAVPVSSISALFGVLFAVLVLDEEFKGHIPLAFLLFTAGVYFIDGSLKRNRRLSQGVVYNLLAAIFWGTSFAMFIYPVREIGALRFSFILELTVCLVSIVLNRYLNKEWFLSFNRIDLPIAFLSFLGFSGIVFYNLSLSYLSVSLVSIMGILTAAISVVFSAILLKERLKWVQYGGIVLIFIGLVIIKFW